MYKEFTIATLENNTFFSGSKVKEIRLKRKLSQMELEIITGLSFGTISRIENGKINPTKETLYKIGVVLKLNKEEMIRLFGLELVI